ncbi:MAG: glycosyltransferase family 2 protein [Candidatus Krumholzibacteriia bacterium]
MNKISVIIIAGNEENNIKDCLESVRWADEIIVVDSESTDRTVEIAKSYTPLVHTRAWQGYANQKTYALKAASHEWVLSLDADERVQAKLAEEIAAADLEDFDGYRIKRDNYFLGRKIRGCGWGRDYQVRLFRKSRTTVTDRPVHEGFKVEGVMGVLTGAITHYSYRTLKEAFAKIDAYSTLEAEEKAHRKSVNPIVILVTPPLAFLHHFIIRRGFIDGTYGAMVSLMHALTKLQARMKIWEMRRK